MEKKTLVHWICDRGFPKRRIRAEECRALFLFLSFPFLFLFVSAVPLMLAFFPRLDLSID